MAHTILSLRPHILHTVRSFKQGHWPHGGRLSHALRLYRDTWPRLGSGEEERSIFVNQLGNVFPLQPSISRRFRLGGGWRYSSTSTCTCVADDDVDANGCDVSPYGSHLKLNDSRPVLKLILASMASLGSFTLLRLGILTLIWLRCCNSAIVPWLCFHLHETMTETAV